MTNINNEQLLNHVLDQLKLNKESYKEEYIEKFDCQNKQFAKFKNVVKKFQKDYNILKINYNTKDNKINKILNNI